MVRREPSFPKPTAQLPHNQNTENYMARTQRSLPKTYGWQILRMAVLIQKLYEKVLAYVIPFAECELCYVGLTEKDLGVRV